MINPAYKFYRMRFNNIYKPEKENCLDFNILDEYDIEEVKSFLNTAVFFNKYYTVKHYLNYFETKYDTMSHEFKDIILRVFSDNLKYCVPAPKCCFSDNGKVSNFSTFPNKNRIELFLYIVSVYPIIYKVSNIHFVTKTIEETGAWDMFYHLISRIRFFIGTYDFTTFRFQRNVINKEMFDIVESHYRIYNDFVSLVTNCGISDDDIINFIKRNKKYFYVSIYGNNEYKFIDDVLTSKPSTVFSDAIPNRCKLLEYLLTDVEQVGTSSRYCGYGPTVFQLMNNYKGPHAKDIFKLLFKHCCNNELTEDYSYDYVYTKNYNDYVKAICEVNGNIITEPEWVLASAISSRNVEAFEDLLKAGYGYALTDCTNRKIDIWQLLREYHYYEFYFIAAKYGYYEDYWIGKYCFCAADNPVSNAINNASLFTKLQNKEITLSEAIDEYDHILYSNASDSFNECYGNSIGHYVVSFGTEEELAALIKAGYELDKKNRKNISALELAIILDKAEMVKLLITAGASTNSKMGVFFSGADYFYSTDIVTLAIMHLSKNVLKYLITLDSLFCFSNMGYKQCAVCSQDKDIMDMFEVK